MSSVRNPLACFALTLGAVVAALAGWAPAARADWSAPQVVASAPPLHLGSGHVSAIGGRVAVDSRGDVAVAWSRTGARPAEYQGRRCSWGPGKPEPKRLGCYPVTTVHLTVVMASGQTVTRVVTSARAEQLIAVVLSPAEATVLLGYTKPRIDSPGGVRVAYGPLIGRWSAPQTISGRWSIGWTNGFPWAQPRLALSPDGTVLVAWNGCLTQHACDGIIGEGYTEQRVVVAWHRPGRPFGPPTVVRAAPLGSVPQFDAAGTAYLSGRCGGTVAIAPAHSRRFSRTIVTSGAAKSFTLALSGAGQGLAAWVAGACSYDELTPPQPGTVFVSLLRASGFDTPFALTAAPAESADAVATPAGVTVSWYVRRFGAPSKPYRPPETPAGKINVTDPDSRNVKTRRGFIQGYNAQAAVNEQQIVVAAEVTVDSPDFGHLGPMVEAAENELQRAGVTEVPEVVVADAGYWHQAQMENIVSRGIQVLVPPDASTRKDTRPGWDGGAYAFMRHVLQADLGKTLYRKR